MLRAAALGLGFSGFFRVQGLGLLRFRVWGGVSVSLHECAHTA